MGPIFKKTSTLHIFAAVSGLAITVLSLPLLPVFIVFNNNIMTL